MATEIIRPYTGEDKPPLIDLLRLNIPRYFAQSEESDFAAYLDHEREDYFVVEEGGKLVGSGGINYFPATGVARLSWDIVHPDFQGQGIGKKLIHYRIGQIRNHPAIRVVMVRTTQLVYPFYQKAGFMLDKVEQDYWAQGFDLYQMTLRLG
jgi:GNAT superfamily N-acetyltransferase